MSDAPAFAASRTLDRARDRFVDLSGPLDLGGFGFPLTLDLELGWENGRCWFTGGELDERELQRFL